MHKHPGVDYGQVLEGTTNEQHALALSRGLLEGKLSTADSLAMGSSPQTALVISQAILASSGTSALGDAGQKRILELLLQSSKQSSVEAVDAWIERYPTSVGSASNLLETRLPWRLAPGRSIREVAERVLSVQSEEVIARWPLKHLIGVMERFASDTTPAPTPVAASVESLLGALKARKSPQAIPLARHLLKSPKFAASAEAIVGGILSVYREGDADVFAIFAECRQHPISACFVPVEFFMASARLGEMRALKETLQDAHYDSDAIWDFLDVPSWLIHAFLS